MDLKKFISGTLAGGVVYFLLGFVFYAVIFQAFFEANAGSASGVMKTEMAWWPLVLGNLAGAALITYVFMHWAQISTFGTGLKGGAIMGFLIALSFDMIMYDTTNIMNLTAAATDIVIATVMWAIVGGVVGAVLGMGGSSSTAAAA